MALRSARDVVTLQCVGALALQGQPDLACRPTKRDDLTTADVTRHLVINTLSYTRWAGKEAAQSLLRRNFATLTVLRRYRIRCITVRRNAARCLAVPQYNAMQCI